METAIIAIVAFVPMLVMLVVIHEWGHFFTARAFGVKVLEFGIGYPPRAFAFYTGRTRVLLDADTQLVNLAGPDELRPGLKVRIYSTEDANGNLVARIMEDPTSGGARRQSSLHDMGRDEYLRHEGAVREAGRRFPGGGGHGLYHQLVAPGRVRAAGRREQPRRAPQPGLQGARP